MDYYREIDILDSSTPQVDDCYIQTGIVNDRNCRHVNTDERGIL
jgi:hypothetical protein